MTRRKSEQPRRKTKIDEAAGIVTLMDGAGVALDTFDLAVVAGNDAALRRLALIGLKQVALTSDDPHLALAELRAGEAEKQPKLRGGDLWREAYRLALIDAGHADEYARRRAADLDKAGLALIKVKAKVVAHYAALTNQSDDL